MVEVRAVFYCFLLWLDALNTIYVCIWRMFVVYRPLLKIVLALECCK